MQFSIIKNIELEFFLTIMVKKITRKWFNIRVDKKFKEWNHEFSIKQGT